MRDLAYHFHYNVFSERCRKHLVCRRLLDYVGLVTQGRIVSEFLLDVLLEDITA